MDGDVSWSFVDISCTKQDGGSAMAVEARRHFERTWSLEGVPGATARLCRALKRLGPERCRRVASDLLRPAEVGPQGRRGRPDDLMTLIDDLTVAVGRVVGIVGRNLTYGTFEDIMALVCNEVRAGEADSERLRSGALAVLAKYDDRFLGA